MLGKYVIELARKDRGKEKDRNLNSGFLYEMKY